MQNQMTIDGVIELLEMIDTVIRETRQDINATMLDEYGDKIARVDRIKTRAFEKIMDVVK